MDLLLEIAGAPLFRRRQAWRMTIQWSDLRRDPLSRSRLSADRDRRAGLGGLRRRGGAGRVLAPLPAGWSGPARRRPDRGDAARRLVRAGGPLRCHPDRGRCTPRQVHLHNPPEGPPGPRRPGARRFHQCRPDRRLARRGRPDDGADVSSRSESGRSDRGAPRWHRSPEGGSWRAPPGSTARRSAPRIRSANVTPGRRITASARPNRAARPTSDPPCAPSRASARQARNQWTSREPLWSSSRSLFAGIGRANR